MSQQDFNRSMGDYLRSKKKKESGKRKLFQRKPKKHVAEEFPELKEGEVHVIPGKKPLLHRIAKRLRKKKSRKKEEAAPEELADEGIEEADPEDFDKEEQEIEEEIERSPSFLEKISKFFRRHREPAEDSMAYDEYDEESELRNELENLEAREEELNVERDELDHRRKELTNKLIAIIDNKRIQEMREERVVPLDEFKGIEDDLAEMAKIAMGVIHKLPRRKLEAFKESDDFRRYKSILRRRKMIRE